MLFLTPRALGDRMADDIERILRDEAARDERLDALLAASPSHKLTGVIAPSGCGACRPRGQSDWTFTLPLAAWRFEGQLLSQSPLTLRKRVDEQQAETLQDRLLPYRLVRVRARVALETELGSPQGLIEEFIDFDPKDAALKQLAADLQNPVVRHEPPFGELLLERSVGWFRGEATWLQTPLRVQLAIDDGCSCDASLRLARTLWEDQALWEQRVKDKVVEELLQIKNDHWLDEGQSPLAAETFRGNLSFESLTTKPDGTFEFWCNDNDMFWGHAITVEGTLERGITSVTLEG
jgi:hypothetical protein